MKHLRIILASLFISLLLMFGSQITNDNACLQARTLVECSTNGYKNWNGFWWNSDGVDCWCNETEKVKNACQS